MTNPTRIYLVARKADEGVTRVAAETAFVDTRRLVRARNSAQAFRHVAEHTLEVSLASQADLVELVGAGIKVEDIKAEPEGRLINPTGEET